MTEFNQSETVRAVPALLYGCPKGPWHEEYPGGGYIFGVRCLISVDDGKTVREKDVFFPSYPMADQFMDQVNKAGEPLHINFFDDPEFDEDMYQDIDTTEEEEEDDGQNTPDNS